MSDVPVPSEMPVNPPLSELAKPIGQTTDAQPEVTTHQEKPIKPEDARETLKTIAAGPQEEAATAPEQKVELDPNVEKMDAMLSQGASFLLDAADPRIMIAAVARSAGATPIGTELKRDTLAMISELKENKLSPEAKESLTKLQQDIRDMNLPKTDPARSEFAAFLEEYSATHPEKAVDPAAIAALRTQKQDAGAAISGVLQTDTGLSTELWTRLKGESRHDFPNVATPQGILKAAGIESTPENTQKAQKLFEPKGPHPAVKLLHELKAEVPSFLMTAGMITMLLSQFINQNEGGGGGHQ